MLELLYRQLSATGFMYHRGQKQKEIGRRETEREREKEREREREKSEKNKDNRKFQIKLGTRGR